MKGKVLAFITAILFGATMVGAPLVEAAQATGSAATETVKPAKKKAKKSTKKKSAKKATKKPSKKKAKTETKA